MGRIIERSDDENVEEPRTYLQATGPTPSTPQHPSTEARKSAATALDSDDEEEEQHSDSDEKSTSQALVKLDHDHKSSVPETNDYEDEEPSSSSSANATEATVPITESTSGRKHHHFGQRLKNKLTGTTHAGGEAERARQAALYRKAYESAPTPAYGSGYGYGGYGYGYGGFGGYGYGLGAPLLFDAALLDGLGGFGVGGLWF